jgi:wobble nucleotide-excising tRNase
MTGTPFIEISEHKNLESRVGKLETVTNDMYQMVKEMHDVFVGSLGQTPLITRLNVVEKDLQEIKEAHAKDRWLVMGGVSVLAFLFSIFGDMFKKVVGLS